MEAIKVVRENIRGIADYAYCIDDDIAIIDDDESINIVFEGRWKWAYGCNLR